MTAFSANLGFLWTELDLPSAIRAAATAGFEAVECHWPYDVPAADVRAALDETGLPMISINAERGDLTAGEFGLAALPGREHDARIATEQALAYAEAIGARNIHVMAGMSSGEAAHSCFVDHLRTACANAAALDIGVLIEPLNAHDAPGYFLCTTAQAMDVIHDVDAPNLRLMFDCYHVQRTEGDLSQRLTDLLPRIGHIQFAGVPNRSTPDQGEVAYDRLFALISALGYADPLGAEYLPQGPTESSLQWLAQ